MSNSSTQLVFRAGKIALPLVLIFANAAGYAFYAEKPASIKAKAMCDSIAVGLDSATLRDRAVADGADAFQTRWQKQGGADVLQIVYMGLPPFSRHVCQVKASNGHVKSVNLSYLD